MYSAPELVVWLACQYISDLYDRIIAQLRPRIVELFRKYRQDTCIKNIARNKKHLGSDELMEYIGARARYDASGAEYFMALHPYKFMREHQNVRHGLPRRSEYHALPSSARRRP